MKINNFIAELINYYYPISEEIAVTTALYLKEKKFSESDLDKLYKYLLKSFSRKWKVTPSIADIEEAEKAINEYADKFGCKNDQIEYGVKYLTCKEVIDKYSEPVKDFSAEINMTFEQLKKKFGVKKETQKAK